MRTMNIAKILGSKLHMSMKYIEFKLSKWFTKIFK